MADNVTSVTSAGLNLIARSQTGLKIEFTAIALGSGIYDGESNVLAYTGLINEQARVPVTSVTVKDPATVKVRALLETQNLEEGFNQTEFGVFAKIEGDEEEVLYAVSLSNLGSYLAPGTESGSIRIWLSAYVNVNNSDNVTIVVSQDESFVSSEELEGLVNTLTLHIEDTSVHITQEERDAWNAVGGQLSEEIGAVSEAVSDIAGSIGGSADDAANNNTNPN